MDVKKIRTIEEIKNDCKFTIDCNNYFDNPDMIIFGFYGVINQVIRSYNFNQKILMIKQAIQDGLNEKNKSEYCEYEKNTNEIKNNIEKYIDEINDGHFFTIDQLDDVEIACKKNRFKSHSNFHDKIIKGILDNSAENYIKYEKQFIHLNDKLIDIFNKINKNF